MCGNHDAMAADARATFLETDQDLLIKKFNLASDENYLYISFLKRPYKIDRTSGLITCRDSISGAPHEVMMAIYDMLCYSKDYPTLPAFGGVWQNLATLGGIVGAGHARRLHTPLVVKPFLGKVDALKAYCESIGGEPQHGGDVSYILPVFDFFPVWFQFWDGDDEFPAQIQFLWDNRSQEFVHYETLFYMTSYMERYFAEIVE